MTGIGVEVKTMQDKQECTIILICSICTKVLMKTKNPKSFTSEERARAEKDHICASENKQGFEEELRHE